MLLPALSAIMLGQVADVRTITAHPRSHVIAPNSQGQIDTLQVRVTSPEGLLWQGPIRVSRNQGANYQQSLSQAKPDSCPPDSGIDRSERRHINFSVYSQHHSQLGPQYRIDVSWARPALDADCGEAGTRTVQVNQTVSLQPGETNIIDGDAGLKVEISRR